MATRSAGTRRMMVAVTSDQSSPLRQGTATDSKVLRIARVMDWIRHNYSQTLRAEELTASVNMSPSTVHQHFQQITTSPLHYQKWLRYGDGTAAIKTARHMRPGR